MSSSAHETHSGIMSFTGPLFVLTGIIAGCFILGGVSFGLIKSMLFAGIAVLAFPYAFHQATVIVLIKQGHTIAAAIIGLFCGFWLLAGVGYICASFPALNAVKYGLDFVLLCVEPVLIIASFYFQRHYYHDELLRKTLIFLGMTVAVLFVTKLLAVSGARWVESFVVGSAGGSGVNMKVAGLFNGIAIMSLCVWILYVLHENFEKMRTVLRISIYDSRNGGGYCRSESLRRPVILMRLEVGTAKWRGARSMMRTLSATMGFLLIECDGWGTKTSCGFELVVFLQGRNGKVVEGVVGSSFANLTTARETVAELLKPAS